MFGKPLNVEFVNNCIRLMVGSTSALPVEGRLMSGQHSQGGLACVRSFSHCQPAIELRRKKYTCRVRVKKNLLRIKAMKDRDRFARHRVCVVTSAVNFAER